MVLKPIREHSLFGSGLEPSGWESGTGCCISYHGPAAPDSLVMAMDGEMTESALCVII